MELRPRQKKAVDMVMDSYCKGNRRIIVVGCTGFGKSHIASEIVQRADKKGSKTLSLVHMRGLVEQLHGHYTRDGVDTGILMAGVESDTWKNHQVASVYTLNRRLRLCALEHNKFFVDADIIILDECHHALSKSFQDVLSNYPEKLVIGFTATPCLSSGVGMGNYFDDLVQPTSVKQEISDGFLVPGVYYGYDPPKELVDCPTSGGDYVVKSLSEIMRQKKLVGNMVDNWCKNANNLLTMAFCVNVSHAKAMCQEYLNYGIPAEQLDAHHPDHVRDATLDRFKRGETRIICQVGLYVEGTDIPEIQHLQIARPTKSLGRWIQMLGRGARPHESKDCFVISDHGGCINDPKLGFYEDDRVWSLHGKALVEKEPKKRDKKPVVCQRCKFVIKPEFKCPECHREHNENRIDGASHIICKDCNFKYEAILSCPGCGNKIKGVGKLIGTTDDELVLIGKAKKRKESVGELKRWFGMFFHHAKYTKKYDKAFGWAVHKWKDKYKIEFEPKFKSDPVEPDEAFLNYLVHLNIRYHKWKKKNAA